MIVTRYRRPKCYKKPAEPVEIVAPRIVHHTRRGRVEKPMADDPEADARVQGVHGHHDPADSRRMTITKISTPAPVNGLRRASMLREPPADQDEQYVSIMWGVLRHPIACTKCGLPTRTPSYWSGDQPSPPICGRCFRLSIWGTDGFVTE